MTYRTLMPHLSTYQSCRSKGRAYPRIQCLNQALGERSSGLPRNRYNFGRPHSLKHAIYNICMYVCKGVRFVKGFPFEHLNPTLFIYYIMDVDDEWDVLRPRLASFPLHGIVKHLFRRVHPLCPVSSRAGRFSFIACSSRDR